MGDVTYRIKIAGPGNAWTLELWTGSSGNVWVGHQQGNFREILAHVKHLSGVYTMRPKN